MLYEGVSWIRLVLSEVSWQTRENILINLGVIYTVEEFF
jgi:hypothetical protein